MTVTRASFQAEFPEFANAATSVIDAKLARAQRVVGTAYGAMQDDAVSYLTAHYLTIDPQGESSALAPSTAGSENWGSSYYLKEYERITASARGGFFGAVADGAT